MLYWQPFVIFIAKSDANCMFTCSEYSRIFLIQCRSFRKRTNYFGEIYLAQNLLAQLRPVDYFNCNFLLRDTVHSKLHQPCRNETKFIISFWMVNLQIENYRSSRTGLPSSKSLFENIRSHRSNLATRHCQIKFLTPLLRVWFTKTKILPNTSEFGHPFSTARTSGQILNFSSW